MSEALLPKRPPAGEVLRESAQLLWAMGRLRLPALVLLSVVQSAIPVLTVWVTARTVDAVAAISGGGAEAVRRGVMFLLLQGVLGSIAYILSMEQRIIQIRLTDKVTFHLREQVLKKIERLALRQLEQPDAHNQLNRFQSGGIEAPLTLFTSVVANIRSALTFGGYLLVLLSSSWIAALATVLMFLISSALENRLSRQEYGMHIGHSPLQRQRDYLWHLLLRPESGKEIRVFGLGAYLRERWAELFIKLRSDELEQIQRRDRASALMQWTTALILVGISASLLWSVSQGRITVGEYVALNGVVIASQALARELSQSTVMSLRYFTMTGDLFGFLHLPEPTPVADSWRPFPAPLRQGIRCEGLTYTYPGASSSALVDVTLTVRSGERIAIVGANGAGKTTLVKCLLGLYRAEAGRVYYDDVNLNDIEPVEINRHVTAVFQDFTRYALSVRENIGFGNLKQIQNDEALVRAAIAADAQFVTTLPEGLDTDLERTLNDGGTDLSGGQWQKLALARALLSEAEVMVLDEPSSALDPEAEAEVYRTFDEATRGKTVFFITHRLGSIRMADRIVVLNGGRVVEQGTHKELLALGGEYSRMYLAQAEWYQSPVRELAGV